MQNNNNLIVQMEKGNIELWRPNSNWGTQLGFLISTDYKKMYEMKACQG